MLSKVISGGQTGADQAALDTAIELGIPHGGWIPRGRKTEKGRLPEKYNLKEMNTASYEKRTERNVIDSDGTLIFSHGELRGGSKLTKDLAEKHSRPYLHIDLDSTNAFSAVKAISYWLDNHGIEVLNVAGPRASEDPEIYDATKKLLSSALRFNLVDIEMPSQSHPTPILPTTVEEAVNDLMTRMRLRDLIDLGKMEEETLFYLQSNLGRYIRKTYGLWTGSKSLMQSCRSLIGQDDLSPDDVSAIIIRELWNKIRETQT